MSSHPRYEILDTIGRGDFATVSRARDHELGREVAVKQIHPQYLEDPQQLDRYWQEAQLLASLEHPHIMTIYDVVRERGWLILELMQGSLSQMLGGNPIDLKDLRLTLNYTLHALQHMHDHGIVHGDIKPGNLMVDRNHRVKLGDFGIARRIQGDDGSVVKGTTKYMAPEVVSDQFGPVGPHSDLYSLGFTAYELMCGSYFESLFPGLSMYGRDKQIAWMMWHSTSDQRLPEIQRVLQGVPGDLTYVIEKLTEKDPARRYRTADEALANLSTEGEAPPAGPTPEELAAAEQQARRAQRKRSLAIAAVACSVVLSIGMLFLSGGQGEPQPPPKVVRPAAGQIVQIDLPGTRFFIQSDEASGSQSVRVSADHDRIFLNGQPATLAELREGDQIAIRYLSEGSLEFKEVAATRQPEVVTEGVIAELNVRTGKFKLRTAADPQPWELVVSDAVRITLNGSAELGGRPLTLANLRPEDRTTVRHKDDDEQPGRRKAVAIDALRDTTARGFFVEPLDEQLKIRVGLDWEAAAARQLVLPLAEDCSITLNGRSDENGRPLTLYDLRAQDTLAVSYDAVVHRIEAFRDVTESGTITDINYGKQSFTVAGADGQAASFRTAPQCRIEVDGEQMPVDFYFLRQGDRVTVQRSSPNPSVRDTVLITVEPVPDSRAWAVVVGQSEYDNPELPPSSFAGEDATAVFDALRIHYRVPAPQLLFEQNGTRVRLEDSLSRFFDKVASDSQLIVYFIGHGYLDAQGVAYLAPQGFHEDHADASGLRLNWLVERMEASPAREKLLLLDTTHQSEDALPERYPAASELAAALKPGPTRPVSASVTVITSCAAGQLGRRHGENNRGRFSVFLARAWEGRGDTNNDHRLDAIELFRFVETEMAQAVEAGAEAQTPELFLPDPTPPRLTAEAKNAVLLTLGYLRGRFATSDETVAARAKELAPGEPEPDLALGLVLLKHNRTLGAVQAFERVRAQHPRALIAYHALAWQYFRRGEYAAGVKVLEQFVQQLPAGGDEAQRAYARHVAEFAGRLAAFALYAAPRNRLAPNDIAGLIAALRQRGDDTHDRFASGGKEIAAKVRQIQDAITATVNTDQKAALERDRTRLTYYVKDFDFDAAQAFLRAELEK